MRYGDNSLLMQYGCFVPTDMDLKFLQISCQFTMNICQTEIPDHKTWIIQLFYLLQYEAVLKELTPPHDLHFNV